MLSKSLWTRKTWTSPAAFISVPEYSRKHKNMIHTWSQFAETILFLGKYVIGFGIQHKSIVQYGAENLAYTGHETNNPIAWYCRSHSLESCAMASANSVFSVSRGLLYRDWKSSFHLCNTMSGSSVMVPSINLTLSDVFWWGLSGPRLSISSQNSRGLSVRSVSIRCLCSLVNWRWAYRNATSNIFRLFWDSQR